MARILARKIEKSLQAYPMTNSKNILFIICDLLRYPYLSCYGHKTRQTPYSVGMKGAGIM